MANGLEDLAEKNNNENADETKPVRAHQFTDWTNFQGREDAEMLQEKQGSRNRFRSLRDYERAYDED
ncbi:MAG: hypothetical protein IJS09_02515 [Treponema sp.]|nr:hypothetical protein [Treponema sp.]